VAFSDNTVAISVPYAAEGDVNATDPWHDVHRRFFLPEDSLSKSVTATRTGTVSTSSGCHVKSDAVIAVVRARAARRADEAKNKSSAEAAAAQRKIEKAAAAVAAAAKKADRAAAAAVAAAKRAAEQAQRKHEGSESTKPVGWNTVPVNMSVCLSPNGA